MIKLIKSKIFQNPYELVLQLCLFLIFLQVSFVGFEVFFKWETIQNEPKIIVTPITKLIFLYGIFSGLILRYTIAQYLGAVTFFWFFIMSISNIWLVSQVYVNEGRFLFFGLVLNTFMLLATSALSTLTIFSKKFKEIYKSEHSMGSNFLRKIKLSMIIIVGGWFAFWLIQDLLRMI